MNNEASVISKTSEVSEVTNTFDIKLMELLMKSQKLIKKHEIRIEVDPKADTEESLL